MKNGKRVYSSRALACPRIQRLEGLETENLTEAKMVTGMHTRWNKKNPGFGGGNSFIKYDSLREGSWLKARWWPTSGVKMACLNRKMVIPLGEVRGEKGRRRMQGLFWGRKRGVF